MRVLDRRGFLSGLGLTGALLSRARPGAADVRILPPHTVKGTGPWILTFKREPAGFLDALLPQYRVVEIDYPPTGVSEQFIAGFTPERVCRDVLAVADEHGADRFAWFGYSWGGVVGLQLATRTPRLTALVCGGWPPLGARYDAMVPPGVRTGDDRMYDTFYRALKNWPERRAVSALRVPRLVFAGTQDVIHAYGTSFTLGPTLASRRVELEQQGWTVQLLEGFGHELGARPDVVVPLVNAFLDPILRGVK
jgi:pimeloyl-ACP methyl ester carboxylesterase